VSIHARDPSLEIIAPVREWKWSREEEIAYAAEHGIPIPIVQEEPFSIDQNIWGRAVECGILEVTWAAPPASAYELTAQLEDTPNEPTYVEIEFNAGIPVAINGQAATFTAILEQLNIVAGAHGIGKIDHIENRVVGIKSREVYEAPGAMTLITAHQALEALTLVREVAHFKPIVEQKLTETIYNGLWYSPLTKALLAFIDETQQTVTGTVRMKLFKGQAIVDGRKSPISLYDEELATYTSADTFDQQAAVGFIKLWGLPTKVQAEVLAEKGTMVHE
jgi:argininosuccinate synthase